MLPLPAPAAGGKLVSECIRKVTSSSLVMGATAEVTGVIACTGIPQFGEKVRRISKCISRVGFYSDATGDTKVVTLLSLGSRSTNRTLPHRSSAASRAATTASWCTRPTRRAIPSAPQAAPTR